MSRDKFYITTSIAYTNAKPHIGYCLELLQADVIARYNLQKGGDVWFLTGTDEHGSKIANKAKELGKSPQEFCDEIVTGFKALKPLLGLSNDDFIRTTDRQRHWPTVEQIWLKLKENGDIYKKKYKGLYCVGCEAFVTEKDLVEGKCPLHQKEPETIEEENYFFKLSKYQKELKKILEENKIKIIPEAKKNEMLSFIKEGLEDVSCSREKSKLNWGVPVPSDNEQTIYVWFEALINYLSALGYLTGENKKFKAYWPPNVQCIGKDIVRFHMLLWPAMLLSLGLKLPENILIHGYMTVGGEKMSKTLGNVIDPFELVEKYAQKIGSKEAAVDAVRYFLLREISPTEDGDFTYERFEARYNSDLANGLGNLLARTITLANKICTSNVVILSQQANNLNGDTAVSFSNSNFQTETEKTKKKYQEFLEGFKFNEALSTLWELISFCDKYINETKPWEGKVNAKEVI
ncbi:MAG: methionine--tRNA ligase, partial [bacterium]|nr:methionine--tRNA ligase [bacterium]